MSVQGGLADARISVRAVRQMEGLALRFRRRLRDIAVELSRQAGHEGPIGADPVVKALPLVCRELLSEAGSDLSDEGEAHGRRPEAA
jgi:hypothetical protein